MWKSVCANTFQSRPESQHFARWFLGTEAISLTLGECVCARCWPASLFFLFSFLRQADKAKSFETSAPIVRSLIKSHSLAHLPRYRPHRLPPLGFLCKSFVEQGKLLIQYTRPFVGRSRRRRLFSAARHFQHHPTTVNAAFIRYQQLIGTAPRRMFSLGW